MKRVSQFLPSRTLGRRLSRVGHLGRAGLGVLALLGLGLASAYQYAGPGQAGVNTDNGIFQLRGKVVSVADGDTFTLLRDGHPERIRMASIDAPETKKSRERPGQPMGQASKSALAELVAGKTLVLDCYEKDRYGRNVCDVPLSDGMTANQRQVASGMAWANMEGRGRFMRDAKLPMLEEQARQSRLGLWQNPKPVKPWVWRYDCWQKGRC